MSALNIALDIIGRDLTGGAFGSVLAKAGALQGLAGGAGAAAAETQVLEGALLGAAAAAALFIGGIKMATDAGAQLEMASTMASIAITDGKQHVEELSNAIVDMANNSQYKIADVDKAFRILGERGFTTAQILQGGLGQASINLGQALGITAVQGADDLSQAMRLMTNDTSNASQVADQLTGAFYNGMNSAAMLRQYLGMTGGTANNLHISLADLLTTGDLLTPMMGGASQSGAALNYMLNQITAPTKAAAGEMQHLGLTFFDAKGNFIGLKPALDEIVATLSKLPQKDRMEAIRALFSTRSGRGAQDLIGMGTEGFDAAWAKIEARIRQVGQAQDDATRINNTALGSWNRLTTTFNDFFAKTGEGINSVLKPLYNWLNNLLSAAQHSDTIVRFFQGFLIAGAAISVVTLLVIAFLLLGSILLPIVAVFLGIVAAAAAVAGAFTILTSKGQLFSGWLSFLNPIVDTVRGAFQFLVKDIQQNSQGFIDLWNAIKPVILVIGGFLAALVVAGVVGFCLAILGIVDAAAHFIEWVEKMWNYLKLFGVVLADVGQLMSDVFQGHWDRIAADALKTQRDWNTASKSLFDQMAADAKAAQDKQALDAEQAALKEKKGVLDAAKSQADQQAAIAYQEYLSNTKLANDSKDAVTKAKYQQAADAALASYNQYRSVSANAAAESAAVSHQMDDLKNNAAAAARQTAQSVLDHMTNMSGGSIEQSRRMKNTVTADLITMKDDGIAAAVQMNSGVAGQLSALQRSTGQWGLDAAQNFANGLLSGTGSVDVAVNQLVMRVASKMQHSVPKEGPLSDDDQWGGHLVENFATGMLNNLHLVDHASTALASAVSRPLTSPSIAASAAAAATVQRGVSQNITIPVYVGTKQVAEVVFDSLKGTLQQNGMSRSLR